MGGDRSVYDAGPSRRAVLAAGGGLIATLAASGGLVAGLMRALDRSRPAAAPARTATPSARSSPPPLTNPPLPAVELHPALDVNLQCFLFVPETDEWFATQASRRRDSPIDPHDLVVGDIVISRMTADGALVDSMTLPDAGHGMGLVVRLEAGVRVVYTCWFAEGPDDRLYDVVRLPYAGGTADRADADTVIPGEGYPVDPYYDRSADAVTLRHQGGGGPQYTRHRWDDFVDGELSHPTGSVDTPDTPPTHQGFCSYGDRFFFCTGAASDVPDGDPPLITEYDWTSGRTVGSPLDTSADSRLPDGTYPGGRMEPEGATIVVDDAGDASLLLGVTNGGPRTPRTYPTFRYPLRAA